MLNEDYSYCPRCLDKASHVIKVVEASYGNIPMDEWNEKMEESKDLKPKEKTVKEYHQFYVQDSTLYITYSGECQNCDFKFFLKHHTEYRL